MSSQTQIFLQQTYERIQSDIAQGKFQDAYHACIEILRLDPENMKFIRLKHTIENEVKKNNRRAIQKDLDQLKPLWKEKKYLELLEKLKTLEPFIPDYPDLQKIIVKTQKKYNRQLTKEKKKYYQNEIEKIYHLREENKFAEALRTAEKLRIIGVKEKELKKTLQDIRCRWIEVEIDHNQPLLMSEKFEDILLFYGKLKKIDPQSKTLRKAIERTKEVYRKYKIEQKKEFIYSSLQHIRTLYQLKKYEKALQAVKEILAIDPYNKEAQKFYRKAARKTDHLIEREVIVQMLSAQKQLKNSYKLNSKAFQKI